MWPWSRRQRQCEFEWEWLSRWPTPRCILNRGHEGPHTDGGRRTAGAAGNGGVMATVNVSAALKVVVEYVGCEGDHHRMWVIDQMVRHLTGPDYEGWIRRFEHGEEGPHTYEWDVGIAP
jgi:hypothetical protein